MRWLLALLMVFILSCSPTQLAMKAIPALFGGGGGGIDTELNVAGEVDKSIKVGESTAIKAENVIINKTVNQNYDPKLLFVSVLGWICPTPRRMWKSLWRKLSGVLRERKLRKSSKNSNEEL